MLGGFLFLLDLERYYKFFVLDFIVVVIWFIGIIKKFYVYVIVIDGLIILDYEDFSCVFGFYFNYYIDDKFFCVLL